MQEKLGKYSSQQKNVHTRLGCGWLVIVDKQRTNQESVVQK